MKILVFTGGEAPEPKAARIFLQKLLGEQKKPDFVVAADSGLESLRTYQDHYGNLFDFSPNLIVGDFDSLSDKKILDGYDARLVERSPAYKDLTDTELALTRTHDFAQGQAQKQKAFITLIGGAGGLRTDHFLAIYNLFGTPLAPDAWICGQQIFYKAQKASFEISGLKPGDTISIARAFGKNSGGKIRSQGLEWESHVFRKKGMPSVSNTIKEEFARQGRPVKIEFLRGSFVLILPLWADVKKNSR